MEKKKVLWKLFVSTLYISAFTFGGGYVIVTLMKKKFVDEYHWIDDDEMLDLTAIAQSSPGAIAVNGAIAVGYKLAGFVGALVSIIATILPPFVIISIISVFYEIFKNSFIASEILTGMQAGVAAVIAGVVCDMFMPIWKEKNVFSIVIFGSAMLATIVIKVNVVYIVLFCIGLGIVRAWMEGRK